LRDEPPNNPLNLTGAAFWFRAPFSPCSGPGKLAFSFGEKTRTTTMDSSDLPYGPVATKFAQLDAHERHIYTFTIQRCIHIGGWQAFWRMKLPGWYPDFTLFVLHLTDKRILVEPYKVGAMEGLAMKGIFALSKQHYSGQVLLAGSGMKEGLEEMKNSQDKWFAISLTEIASVEKQEYQDNFQKLMAWRGVFLVKIAFKNPAVEPLVFAAMGAEAGLFTLKGYNKEFIAAMGQILHKT